MSANRREDYREATRGTMRKQVTPLPEGTYTLWVKRVMYISTPHEEGLIIVYGDLIEYTTSSDEIVPRSAIVEIKEINSPLKVTDITTNTKIRFHAIPVAPTKVDYVEEIT